MTGWQKAFWALVAVLAIVGLVGVLKPGVDTATRPQGRDPRPLAYDLMRNEAQQAMKALRSCVKLAEESVTDFERTARSRDRWKRRALAAEAEGR